MPEKNSKLICEYAVKAAEEMIFNTLSGFLLVFVKEGAGTFCLNGIDREYRPGTTVIMSCVDYLKKYCSDSDVRILTIKFSEEILSGRMLEFFSITDLPVVTTFDDEYDKIRGLFDMVVSSADGSAQNDDIFIYNLTKELLIYTIKNEKPYICQEVCDIKTELAILYVYAHFRESVSLEGVAAYVHYSANYFYHSFQKNTGTTFQKFLHNLRLDYAMNLLRFTELSVSDICYECGFGSVQYFSTSFRKKFGKSPKHFQNLNT